MHWFIVFATPDKSDDTDLLSKSDQGKVRWNLARNNQMTAAGVATRIWWFGGRECVEIWVNEQDRKIEENQVGHYFVVRVLFIITTI